MSTETTPRIAVSRENLPHVIAKAFDLSKPQGSGFLHFKEGGIPETTLQPILARSDAADSEVPHRKMIEMDYVDGRAVKLSIPYDKESGGFYLDTSYERWYDHSDAAWDELKQFAKSMNSAALPA